MALETGTKLGRYEIRSLLGEGGMGEVYVARDPRLGRDVAIKVLPPDFSADAERLRRFEQEAQAAGTLNRGFVGIGANCYSKKTTRKSKERAEAHVDSQIL